LLSGAPLLPVPAVLALRLVRPAHLGGHRYHGPVRRGRG